MGNVTVKNVVDNFMVSATALAMRNALGLGALATKGIGDGLIESGSNVAVDPDQVLNSLEVTDPIIGSVDGNAATATALETARTINGVSFNGTANIVVAAAAGTLTGTTLAANVIASSLESCAEGSFGDIVTQDASNVNISGGSIDGVSITGLADPINANDAANKAYVDSAAAGLTPRTGVRLATTANISLTGEQTIDGVAAVAGDRILVKSQSAPAENGIYDVAVGAWSRSTDSNTSAELQVGFYYFVSSGTTNGSTGWFIQTEPTTLGVDPVAFAQFSASSSYSAGTGINLVGSQFSIAGTQTGLTINSGTFNGTIGSTSPNSGVFTTATVKGTGSAPYFYVWNTTSPLTGAFGSIFNSAVLGIGSITNHDLAIYRNNTEVGRFSSSGLSVTGALSATGNLTLSGGVTKYTGTDIGAGSDVWVGSDNVGGLFANAPTGEEVRLGINNSAVARVSSTGLAVTGAVSATGTIAASGNLINMGSGSTLTPYIQHTAATVDIKGGSTGGVRILNNAGTVANAVFADAGGLAVTGTLGVTGSITSTASGLIFQAASAGINNSYQRIANTGGNLYFGKESSVGGTLLAGTTAYAAIFSNESNFPVQIGVNNAIVGSFSSTGLAVTGGVTATSTGSFGSAVVASTTGNNDAFLSLNNSGGTYGGFTWNVRGEYDTGKLRFIGSSPWMEIDYANGATTFTTLAASSNANLRATKGNLNIIVNVKDYGATGDGSTDDTSAIAAAAAALAPSNCVLYFPAGTYLTSAVIAITSKTGLSVLGDGRGAVTIRRSPTGGQVMNISASTKVVVRGITFDGNCAVRTAGQQAVTIDASNVMFSENGVTNSGEYAAFFGPTSANTDVQIIGNYIYNCYADGINLQNVQKFVIADNVIDGADDDLIAIGYNGSGVAQYGTVTGNFCRARSDLATTWGRGIALIGCSDVHVVGNQIYNVKQSGLYIAKEAGARVARCTAVGNTIYACARNSGHSIVAYGTTDCTLEGNDVINPVQGNLIELADWANLSIKGGKLTQNTNVFARGIHADEGTGWSSTTWTNLKIKGVTIELSGASTNSGIYLVPNAANTISVGLIDGCDVQQVVAGDYITITGSATTRWKIVNNTDMTGSRTINQSTGGVFTVTNNN